jgi:hypothetical protein
MKWGAHSSKRAARTQLSSGPKADEIAEQIPIVGPERKMSPATVPRPTRGEFRRPGLCAMPAQIFDLLAFVTAREHEIGNFGINNGQRMGMGRRGQFLLLTLGCVAV